MPHQLHMADDKKGPSTADHIGEAAGGITGVVGGAAIGASAGPVGVLLGGIAGAIGGWWTGRALSEAAEDVTEADEEYYRSNFAIRAAPTPYEDARRAYYLGQMAASAYDGKSFAEIESQLAKGWACAGTASSWDHVRGFAAVGYERGGDRRRTRAGSNRRSS